ncbi:hypothetical protein JMG10_06660 [Nostoc ellipsosporum NOK]|jgi:hypothetical protein|nr:hypothetical protein [Nostoc ellipsosporum NOK]
MSEKKHMDTEEIMDSLDGIRRATPSPFLYTRVKARLQKEGRTIWERLGTFVARPVITVSTLVLVLIFNAVIVLNKEKSVESSRVAISSPQENNNSSYDETSLLAATTSYDYVNAEP